MLVFFFFSSRRRHTRLVSDWSSDVCSSDILLLHRARQTLRLAQMMAMRQDRTNQVGIFVREEGIQRHDRRQTAIDGSGFESPFALQHHETIYFFQRDFIWRTVSPDFHEKAQVIAIVPPRARSRVASAHPVDEPFDFD